jgi:hypothetical protein
MVLSYERNNNFLPFSQFVLPMLFFPKLPIASPNNEQHNLENKDLKNDGLKG